MEEWIKDGGGEGGGGDSNGVTGSTVEVAVVKEG